MLQIPCIVNRFVLFQKRTKSVCSARLQLPLRLLSVFLFYQTREVNCHQRELATLEFDLINFRIPRSLADLTLLVLFGKRARLVTNSGTVVNRTRILQGALQGSTVCMKSS
jgi:hypothetical protein